MTVDFTDWWTPYYMENIVLLIMLIVEMLLCTAYYFVTEENSILDKIIYKGFKLLFPLGLMAIILCWIFAQQVPTTFTEAMQTKFHITQLQCHPKECTTFRLADNGTQATWMQNGKRVNGRILVDGNKVTLAPNS